MPDQRQEDDELLKHEHELFMQINKETEVAPCPFCGCRQTAVYFISTMAVACFCSRCRAQGGPLELPDEMPGHMPRDSTMDDLWRDMAKHAVGRWNNRQEPDPPEEVLDKEPHELLGCAECGAEAGELCRDGCTAMEEAAGD